MVHQGWRKDGDDLGTSHTSLIQLRSYQWPRGYTNLRWMLVLKAPVSSQSRDRAVWGSLNDVWGIDDAAWRSDLKEWFPQTPLFLKIRWTEQLPLNATLSSSPSSLKSSLLNRHISCVRRSPSLYWILDLLTLKCSSAVIGWRWKVASLLCLGLVLCIL